MKHIYDRPLDEGETEERASGCRHSNPDICAKHSMPKVCAFVTKDGVCYAPPASWKKLYKKLCEDRDK